MNELWHKWKGHFHHIPPGGDALETIIIVSRRLELSKWKVSK